MSNELGNLDETSGSDEPLFDPSFEALLKEALGGPEPPDLSARILASLHCADSLAETACSPISGTVNAGDIVLARRTDEGSSGSTLIGRVPLAMVLGIVSLAASVMLAFWMFPLSETDRAPLQIQVADGADNSTQPTASDSSTNGLPRTGLQETTGTDEAENATLGENSGDESIRRPRESRSAPIKLDGPTFADSPGGEFGSGRPVDDIPSFPRPKVRLDDDAIVKLIDQRLLESWAATDTMPSGEVAVGDLASRVNELLGANLLGVNTEVTVKGILAAVENGSRSREVQERLASRLAGSLLGRTGVRRINREQFVQFVSFLSPAMTGEKRYDDLVSEMLSARGSVEPKSDSFNPATVWMGALAGPQSIALAEQAGHALLDVDLRCGRCHDHPLDGRVWQDQYWQFSAMFETGLQWQVDQKGALKVSSANGDEKRNVVFFEKTDGRQRAATPKTPLTWIAGASINDDSMSESDSSGTLELQRLAASMSNNPQLARATVNRVWHAVYGRPLVGSVADPASAPETEALNRLQAEIAEQFRAHNFDIGRLFAWVIASKPMQLDVPENWLSPKFESASTAEIALAAEQVRNFASYPGSVPRRRFNDLLARVNVSDSNLIESLDAANNFPGGLLGQIQPKSNGANEVKQNNNRQAPKADQLLAASLEAMEHRRGGGDGEQGVSLPADWLAQVGGPDPFQRRAEHLYYLAGYWHPSPQQLEVARALREQATSDQAALRKLWWVLANESL